VGNREGLPDGAAAAIQAATREIHMIKEEIIEKILEIANDFLGEGINDKLRLDIELAIELSLNKLFADGVIPLRAWNPNADHVQVKQGKGPHELQFVLPEKLEHFLYEEPDEELQELD
jgi:hypothetical protein